MEKNKNAEDFQTDHAGSNESSIVMYFRPDLVKMDNLPSDINEWPLGILGRDPRRYASFEKGKRIVEYQKNRMVELLKKELEKLPDRK